MGNSCWWKPCVKNNNGEDVISKLWEDIYRLTGEDRAKSKRLYKIATDENFIDTVKDQAEFDENGQITAHSFFKLSGLSSEIDDTLKTINNERSKDNISSEEALTEVESFNRDESYKDDYVPQLIYSGDDNYSITFTERNTESVEDLQKKINDITLTKFVANRLRELGVAYDFVGKSQHSGRFSTRNAEQMSDGLYHLIEISKGKDVDVNDVLLEEAAHLATISMKDNSLIKRLLAVINEDTIHELFTEEEIASAKLNTEEGKLELAGILVKKALSNKYGKVIGYDNFLSRIKQAIFNVFSKLGLDKILSDKQRAKTYAEQIANGFLYNDNAVDIDYAVNQTNVELFSVNLDGTNKLLQESMQRISELQSNVRNASSAIWNTLLKDVRPDNLTKGKPIDSFTYEEAAAIIGTGINNLLDSFKLIIEELKGLNFEGDIDQDGLLTLFSASEMYSTIKDLTNLAHIYLAEGTEDSTEIVTTLQKAIDAVNDYINEETGIADKILDAQRLMTAQIFEEILGKKSYQESARIVFNGLHLDIKNATSVSTYKLASKYINEKRYNEINRIASYIRHLNNAEDITTQLFYQAVRRLKINESRRYKESLIELAEIEKDVKKSGINITSFYQKYDDGSFTGNFICKYNFAQLYQDREDALNRIKKDFIKYLHDIGKFDEFMHQTKEEKMQQFIEFRDMRSDWLDVYNLKGRDIDKLNDWLNHGEEDGLTPEILSAKDEILKLLEPYKDREYQNLVNDNDQFEPLLNRIKAWKEFLDDDCLRENIESSDSEDEDIADKSYKLYVRDRIPQYRSGLITKMKNKGLIKDKDLYNERHIHEINLNVTSDDFGSPIMDKKLDEFNDEYSLVSDAIRRIPLHGINKLNNLTELSTNLFESLSVYAGMAHRYRSTQELYPQLKLVNDTLNKRENNPRVGDDIIAREVSGNDRQKMIDDYITPKNKKRNIVYSILAKLGMVASIRVLCLNIMSALKNWNGGYRVILNDAISGNGNFSLRDLMSATGRNFNPIHTISSLATIWLNKEQTWDKYQNLIRRWDAARNPHVHTVVGISGGRKVFNYITNVIMQNYSLTDESLIAIIYDSHMSNKIIYDSAGNRIKLSTDGYEYKDGKNPVLKNNLIKRKEDIDYWNKLDSALKAIDDIIENNKAADKDDEKMRLDDKSEITELLDYVEDTLNKSLPIYRKEGGFKSIEEVHEVLEKELKSISFTEEDEVILCEQINDYITSSQGLYGALNANAIQSNAELAMFSKLKGWLFGFMQRNLLSNPSALAGDYKASVWGSTLLALACIFGNTKRLTGSEEFWDNAKFKLAVAVATFIPFALTQRTDKKSGNKLENQLRKYLTENGWSPDQLSKLSFFIVGWFMQYGLHVISKYLLTRGNYKKWGQKYKVHKLSREGKPIELEEHGLLFPDNLIIPHTERFNEQFKKWSKPNSKGERYPYSSNQKVNIDGKYSTYSALPKVNENTIDKYRNKIFMTKDTGKCYSYDEKNHQWKEKPWGYYRKGTEEWNEHVAAMKYSNYGYDTQSVAYHLLGAANRLSKGVEDEGVSLMNPLRMYSDIRELFDPIIVSTISTVYQGVKMTVEGRPEQWTKKEANFWLGKFGLELDGDGYPVIGEDLEHRITLTDWYEKQEAIERFRIFKNK